MNLKGFHNFDSKYERRNLRESEIDMKLAKDEESKRTSQVDLTSSLDESKTQSQNNLLSDYISIPNEYKTIDKYTREELRNLPVDVIPYKELSFIKKFVRIFTPFELMYKKIWIND